MKTYSMFSCALTSLLAALSLPLFLAQQTGVNDYRIHLSGYEFDPLVRMPAIDTALKTVPSLEDSVYMLVQFRNSLTRQQTEQLQREHGLRLEMYIPNFTYLASVLTCSFPQTREEFQY